MHTRSHRHACKRGSAVITAILFSTVAAAVIVSVLGLAMKEQSLNRRHILHMEARNTAESASEYVVAQVKSILQAKTDFSNVDFTSGDDAVTAPDASYFANTNLTVDSVEVVAGMETTTSGTLTYLDPTASEYRDNNYAGTYAYIRRVPIVARATLSNAGSSTTAHAAQNLEAYIMPLFTFAVFYDFDTEFFPLSNTTIYGPVHSNGDLYVRKCMNGSLTFRGRVSSAGALSARLGQRYITKVWTIDYPDGHNGSSCTVNFTNPAGTSTNLYGHSNAPAYASGSPIWRDQRWGSSSTLAPTAAQEAGFVAFTRAKYGTNLVTSAHNIDPLTIAGIDQVGVGRTFINPPAADDNAWEKSTQLARQCGLIIVANPDDEDRIALVPGKGSITVKKHSYRAFTRSGTELVLPGQPEYVHGGSYKINTLANRPATAASFPYINAVVRMDNTGNTFVSTYAGGSSPLFPTLNTGTFHDIRRMDNAATGPSAGSPFAPRLIQKVDIDLTALKKAVDRSINGRTSSSVFLTGQPADATEFASSIYNPSGNETTVTLSDADAIYDAGTELPIGDGDFWNGGVYILSVDAEDRTRTSGNLNRLDSGVRFVNGRGHIASKALTRADGSTVPQGLTLVTNDASYIIGHFNADGTIHTGATTDSSRFPDDAGEPPAAIMADAITILSQPVFAASSGVYRQNGGWNDNLSSLRHDDSGWSSDWRTTKRQVDGFGNTITAGLFPTLPNLPASSSVSASAKFLATNTEVSAGFLTGISESNGDLYSGGVQNYPRFLEEWFSPSKTCAIRGSMVAMFFSRIADEPWNSRNYMPPVRQWGLHNSFIEGTLPPLTPNTVALQQLNFRNLADAEYAAEKARIVAF